ncbi:hypothetical protein [Halobacillus sp. Marseille-Q1614]|uniref:hypothetical protein n=1 Tax=Halobacillus sp. Marseille-Q1614 TaxID=2709134 RepID=UPI0015704F70|nr:hypothetical protein [Halobacillus sp. Marseille-Q1614]
MLSELNEPVSETDQSATLKVKELDEVINKQLASLMAQLKNEIRDVRKQRPVKRNIPTLTKASQTLMECF